jgi:hypothetical protein
VPIFQKDVISRFHRPRPFHDLQPINKASIRQSDGRTKHFSKN